MKTLFRITKLRSVVLAAVFVLLTGNKLVAQTPPCTDPCPPGPLKTFTQPLCNFSWSGTVTDPVTNTTWPASINAPFVFVIINYREKTCNGRTIIVIEDYVYVDNRDYWQNLYPANYIVTPPINSAINSAGCGYASPPTAASIKQAITNAVNIFVGGAPYVQSNLEVYFPGSCYSLVHLSFPNSSFWANPNDLGGIDTVYFSSGSNVSQSIPCNDACCKVTYRKMDIILDNGTITQIYKPILYEASTNPGCGGQPLPNYHAYPNKMEATVIDPVTGLPTKVTGVVTSQEPCEQTCSQYVLPKPAVSTDLSREENPIEFMACPTLVNHYIHFTSVKEINKVVIYDMTGKIVTSATELPNNELKTTGLPPGAYFILVHFSDSDVRTVKILKQ